MAANWKTTLSALVSACLIYFASQPATAKESITWMLSDYPPIGIAETWMPKESLSEYRQLYDEVLLGVK